MNQQLRIQLVRSSYAQPAYAHIEFPAAKHAVGNARSDPSKIFFNPASAIPIVQLDQATL